MGPELYRTVPSATSRLWGGPPHHYDHNGEHHGNIIIAKNGITLDCAGHDVTGDGSMGSIGINLVKRKNVTVKNCYVHDFTAGFVLNKSRGNTLEDNTAINNSVDGFFAFRSSNNRLVENTAEFNGRNGFRVVGESPMNTLEENVAFDNDVSGSGAASMPRTTSSQLVLTMCG